MALSWVEICESAYCETLISLFVHCVISIIVRQIPVRHFPVSHFPVLQFPPCDFVRQFWVLQFPPPPVVRHFPVLQIPVTRPEYNMTSNLSAFSCSPLQTYRWRAVGETVDGRQKNQVYWLYLMPACFHCLAIAFWQLLNTRICYVMRHWRSWRSTAACRRRTDCIRHAKWLQKLADCPHWSNICRC